MPAQEELQSQSSAIAPSAPRSIRGGQHVSGDVWRSAFKETKADRLAKFLGWFSIGLGMTELLFPNDLAKAIGTPRRPTLTRMMGLREIAAGVGILCTPVPKSWMKARVAGDAVDLALLFRSYGARRSRPARITGATAMVAGVTALDIYCANQLSTEPAAVMQSGSKSGAVRTEASISINKSPEECYGFWRHLENLPQFMRYLDSVQVTGDKTSHWTLKTPPGRMTEWDAEIIADTPNEEIAWRSLPGSALSTSGSVRFDPRLSGPGVIVRVAMEYTPPGGQLLAMAAPLMDKISEHQLKEDLRHLKSLMETGEVATTQGQPTGRKGGKQ